MRATHGLLTLAVLLVGTACGGANSASTEAAMAGRAGGRSSRIGTEEIRRNGQYSNLYHLVEHLRPRWLRSQGPDTFMAEQGQVQVHMDGNHLGSVDQLRSIALIGVTSIEWLAPVAAAGRFGFNHSHGAIVVSSTAIP